MVLVDSVLYVPVRSPLVLETDGVVDELVNGKADAVLSVGGGV